MVAKQYATKKPVGHWRNQIGNKKYLKTNENGNIMIQNLCSTTKAILRGKFLLQETKKSQISQLTLHQKELEKQVQAKSKVIRKKEK